jgi:hypothetical protein
MSPDKVATVLSRLRQRETCRAPTGAAVSPPTLPSHSLIQTKIVQPTADYVAGMQHSFVQHCWGLGRSGREDLVNDCFGSITFWLWLGWSQSLLGYHPGGFEDSHGS